MSRLEAYVAACAKEETFDSLSTKLHTHMIIIKQEAEAMAYRLSTDEEFQHQIASLCLSVQLLKEQVMEAETGIERFVQNTPKKWRTYEALQQDLLRLLNAKTIEAVGRAQRLDRSSIFNVVKVNAHAIELNYANKALVPPSTIAVIPKPGAGGEESNTSTLEIFQSSGCVELVKERATDLVARFVEAQSKVRIYQAYYDRLGNVLFLASEYQMLRQKMEDVASYVAQQTLSSRQEECDTYNAILREHIDGVSLCFKAMQEILSKERDHCRQYMFNTVERFTECSTTYQKLLAHLRLHRIELDCLKTTTTNTETMEEEEEGCSSMYQKW